MTFLSRLRAEVNDRRQIATASSFLSKTRMVSELPQIPLSCSQLVELLNVSNVTHIIESPKISQSD